MNTETLLGSYEVSGFFSEAGLDDLYLGTDTRDGGEVAIRALPVFFDEDAIIERLQGRARDIASLNEPGLLFVTEVSKSDGAVLAVTPRPRAKALDRHLPPDGLLPGDVFGVSLGLVTAIDALHRGGFLHGYLHAGRVLVTDDHDVRVLTIGPEEAEDPPSTRVAACRPPESWTGEDIDACGEVFSLGVLLHQAATGELPFEGDTADELARSIQEDIPRPVTEIRPDLPRELAVIIARCLKKNREHRYPSAEEVLADLERLKEAIVAGKVTVGRQADQPAQGGTATAEEESKLPWAERLPDLPAGWGVAALGAGGLIVAFALGLLWGGSGPVDAARVATHLEPATFYPGQELFPSLSADGTEMVFSSNADGDWNLFALRAGEVHPTVLTADSSAADYQPALSPDSTRIAFRSERDGGGIFVMDRFGGTVKQLGAFGFNPSWSPDGREVAVAEGSVFDSPHRTASDSKIWAVDAESGDRRQVTSGNGFQPSWSPDGGRVAYWWPRAGSGGDIWTTPADGGEPVAVTDDAAMDWNPVWSPDGYLYFSSDRSGSLDIWRVRIDESSGLAEGVPEQVTTSGSVNGVHPTFALASGEMAYVEAASVQRLYRIPFDPGSGSATGPPEPLPGGLPNAAVPHLSAGGDRMAFVLTQGAQADIYVADRDGSGAAAVTRDKARDLHPRLAPDGRHVAFLSQRDGFYQLFTAEPDGSSPRQLTELTASHVSAPVWSPDSSTITVTIGTNMTPSYTLLFDAGGSSDQVAETLHTTPSNETFEPNSWSRGGTRLAGDIRQGNGRRGGIAMLSVETGEYEQLTDFGIHPVWLRDGRRLLFQWGARIYLLDTRSPEPREVFDSGSDVLAAVFSLTSDDRWIYASLERREADVWRLRQ